MLILTIGCSSKDRRSQLPALAFAQRRMSSAATQEAASTDPIPVSPSHRRRDRQGGVRCNEGLGDALCCLRAVAVHARRRSRPRQTTTGRRRQPSRSQAGGAHELGAERPRATRDDGPLVPWLASGSAFFDSPGTQMVARRSRWSPALRGRRPRWHSKPFTGSSRRASEGDGGSSRHAVSKLSLSVHFGARPVARQTPLCWHQARSGTSLKPNCFSDAVFAVHWHFAWSWIRKR